ncbi:MAG TPA: hypothetical protein PLL86_00360 [Leptospiraceae bacterium]|nr:hypothetical protein [Leptospiraceae bacterium]
MKLKMDNGTFYEDIELISDVTLKGGLTKIPLFKVNSTVVATKNNTTGQVNPFTSDMGGVIKSLKFTHFFPGYVLKTYSAGTLAKLSGYSQLRSGQVFLKRGSDIIMQRSMEEFLPPPPEVLLPEDVNAPAAEPSFKGFRPSPIAFQPVYDVKKLVKVWSKGLRYQQNENLELWIDLPEGISTDPAVTDSVLRAKFDAAALSSRA